MPSVPVKTLEPTSSRIFVMAAPAPRTITMNHLGDVRADGDVRSRALADRQVEATRRRILDEPTFLDGVRPHRDGTTLAQRTRDIYEHITTSGRAAVRNRDTVRGNVS